MKDRKIFVSTIFFSLGLISMAQGSTPPPPMPPPPPGLPIDNGIILLFFLALSFGTYKAYKFSRKNA